MGTKKLSHSPCGRVEGSSAPMTVRSRAECAASEKPFYADVTRKQMNRRPPVSHVSEGNRGTRQYVGSAMRRSLSRRACPLVRRRTDELRPASRRTAVWTPTAALVLICPRRNRNKLDDLPLSPRRRAKRGNNSNNQVYDGSGRTRIDCGAYAAVRGFSGGWLHCV